MPDKVPITFQLYRVRGKEDQLAAILQQQGFGRNWSPFGVVPDQVLDNGCYCGLRPVAVLTELGQVLQQLGVPYSATQSNKTGDAKHIILFTPELGEFSTLAAQTGEVLVHSNDITKAVKDCPDNQAELIKRLQHLTGTAWVEALKSELTAGSIEDQVYRSLRAGGMTIADAESAVRVATTQSSPPPTTA